MVQYETIYSLMRSAHYDIFGNIILDIVEEKMVQNEETISVGISDRTTCLQKQGDASSWTLVHDSPRTSERKSAPHERLHEKQKSSGVIKNFGERTKLAISSLPAESASQFHATAGEVQSLISSLRSSPQRIHSALRSFLRKANTPLSMQSLLPKSKKPPTRLRLFLVDTVRFGGTFAGIFIILFMGINAQSFFQIAKAELALGDDLNTQQALEEMVTGVSGRSEMIATDTMREQSESDVLSLLPSVGPFENRLIIPKLGKNIPIVRPSMDGLMQENWKKFEDDIQSALKGGVVHYPGSARPGQAGNFFVTGHSSYYPWDDGSYKDVFARLKDLLPGDTYSVYYGGDKHTYRITSKKEVKPSDVSVLDQPTDQRIATLMTCTPIGTTLRRLIVMAEEIDPTTGEILTVGEKAKKDETTPRVRLESLPI